MTINKEMFDFDLGAEGLSFYVYRSGMSLLAFLKKSNKSSLNARQKQQLLTRTLTGEIQMKTGTFPQSKVPVGLNL